ncbi:MAG: acyl-CoA dehydrogenase family protein [Acidimicrobiia bacterium]
MTTTPRLSDPAVLGPEHRAVPDDHPFRHEFRDWLAAHVPGVDEPGDEDERFRFRRRWQQTLHEGGWAGPAWPEEYGGRGAGALEQFMYYEELALAHAPQPVNAPGIILLGPTLMVHGSGELRARFLPGILSASEMWCQGFSEPNSGSDLASLRTRAHLDGDEWVITGQKVWTTWAHYADYCFVLCRTEPGSERHRGMSLLVCPMGQPGVTARPITQITGDAEFGEVFLDEARCPRDFIVGAPGEGWTAAMTMFQFERADQGFTCHARLLVQLAAVRRALRHAAGAGALSAPAIEAARLRYADLWVRAQQLRRINLRNALRVEAGGSIGPSGSLTKIFWSELEKDVAALHAGLFGSAGLVEEARVSKELLASRAASIYSGTTEIQRNIVAELVLGLPR